MSDTDAQQCGNCAYFDNAPASLERLIPGLRSLGSGFAAVRDRDGLCSVHDRYLPTSAGCPQFSQTQRFKRQIELRAPNKRVEYAQQALAILGNTSVPARNDAT